MITKFIDLLSDKGNFSSNGFSMWRLGGNEHSVYERKTDKEHFIEVNKLKNSTISFGDGFSLDFETEKPQHLRFFYSSTNRETEDTNLRLKN